MDQLVAPEPARRPRRKTWIGALAAVGIGMTLGAVGIAAAADPSPSPSSGSGATTVRPDPAPGEPGMGQGWGRRHGPDGPGGFGMGDAVHGELVVPDGTGWRTVAMQRGEVTSVSSTALTVKSKDGYTKTYVVTADTMVNAARDGIGSIKEGDEVGVLATVKSGTATAGDVRDLTQLKAHRKDFGPPPGGPEPGGPEPAAPGGTPASPSSYDGAGGGQPA